MDRRSSWVRINFEKVLSGNPGTILAVLGAGWQIKGPVRVVWIGEQVWQKFPTKKCNPVTLGYISRFGKYLVTSGSLGVVWTGEQLKLLQLLEKCNLATLVPFRPFWEIYGIQKGFSELIGYSKRNRVTCQPWCRFCAFGRFWASMCLLGVKLGEGSVIEVGAGKVQFSQVRLGQIGLFCTVRLGGSPGSCLDW